MPSDLQRWKSYYGGRSGLYWCDIPAIIQRNLTPHAQIRFSIPMDAGATKVTLCDFSRRHFAKSGYIPEFPNAPLSVGTTREALEIELSQVCNLTYDKGWMPFFSGSGARGVVDMIALGLSENTLRPSDELSAILNKDSNQYAPRERYYA